jgi:hypothetical protein
MFALQFPNAGVTRYPAVDGSSDAPGASPEKLFRLEIGRLGKLFQL